jgi:hypothetical protein
MVTAKSSKIVRSQSKKSTTIVGKGQANAGLYADLAVVFMSKSSQFINKKSLQS